MRYGNRPLPGPARRWPEVVALGVVLAVGALGLWSGPALAGESNGGAAWKDRLPFNLSGKIEAGGQYVNERGNSSTFDEYRDLDSGLTVPRFRLFGEDRGRTRYLEIGGSDLTRTDAYYFMNAGIYNWFKFNFEYDRIPHVLANNAQTIYAEAAPGLFFINGPTAPLQAALTAPISTPPTVAQRTNIINAVNGLLQPTKLGFQTDTARIGLSWLPLPDLEFAAGYSFTTRDGKIPVGTVIGSPGGNVLELAAPRDERIHEFKFGADYVRDWYQFRLNYTYSLFENDVNRIEWANPCGTGANCGNPSGLGRYSTMPENYAHTISGATGVTLPWWATRLTGALSYSMWRQDETFLPYTTVAGFTGNATDAGASSPDASMDVLLLNLGLTARPLRDVTVGARYRLYDLENDTPEHTFTSVLNPGDLTPAATNNTHTSEPLAFRKQNVNGDVSWRIVRPLTVRAGYEYEQWDRKHRETDSTSENIGKAGLDFKPWSWLLARLQYSHGVRVIKGVYEPLGGNATALPQFRKFDQADRTRDKGDVLLQITPIDTLSVSGSFYVQNDNYFNTTYGLNDAEGLGWSADVSWAPLERLNLFAGYARDKYKSIQQNCAIGAGPPTPCNPLDSFVVKPKDTLDVVNAGLNVVVIPSRLDLSLGYQFSFGQSKYEFSSTPGGAATGEPAALPEVENTFHIFNVVASYFLTKQWTLKLGYQYERYSEKDFTTDTIQPSVAAVPGTTAAADLRSIVLGAKHPAYEAHIVAMSVAYRF
ncbi:MAG: MtrB/PioB family decaheme-associated outer membrane protein [Zetaproteobacteria bacterium]|nr:MAG: MtrB/PioB family decaheme-associated outer membrane protein [Zetaproteobacteria bacterium]